MIRDYHTFAEMKRLARTKRKREMDIETMRGEIIQHKNDIQMLKTAVADLQARVTKLENEVSSPVLDPLPGEPFDPRIPVPE